MKVAVETLDLSDDALKSIRRYSNQNGKATRSEAKDFISKAIEDVIANLVINYPPNKRPQRIEYPAA